MASLTVTARLRGNALSAMAMPGAGALRERVLHDFVFAARSLYGPAELGVVFDRDALERRENDGRNFGKLGFQLVQVLLFFAALLHNLARLVSRHTTPRRPAPPV